MLRLCVKAQIKLQEENTELRKRFQTYSQHAATVQDQLLADHRPYAVDAGSDGAGTASMSAFRSLTLRECHDIVDTDDLLIAARDPRGLKQPVSVCGWEGYRDVSFGNVDVGDATQLAFHLRKRFTCSAVSAAGRVWAIAADPLKLASMFSTAFNMQFRFLQAVNDEFQLFYREMGGGDSDGEGGSNTLELPYETAMLLVSKRKLSARRRGGGSDSDERAAYRIQLRAMDPRLLSDDSDALDGELQAKGRTESLHWVEIHTSGYGRGSGEQEASCVVEFGGLVSIPPEGDGDGDKAKRVAELWAAEIALQCLRAEATTSNVRYSVTQN